MKLNQNYYQELYLMEDINKMNEDDNQFHFWIGSIGLVVLMVYLMIWLIEA